MARVGLQHHREKREKKKKNGNWKLQGNFISTGSGSDN